jgi:xylulose-5-phosphate/fructose-6-phosphate phosphoketolase
MEMLSEHQCEGWLEGYLLTGRHGFFNCYEAFIHIVDSMFNQHAKWLKVTRTAAVAKADRLAQLPAGLACLAPGSQRLHHQDPGFIDHVVNKKAESRAGLPAAGRQLPALGDGPLPAQPPLRQRRGRRQAPGAAVADDGSRGQALRRGHRHLALGQQRSGGEPDVVMACCGDVPTLETLAAVSILREHLPELKIRVVNVVDLMKLQPQASIRTA